MNALVYHGPANLHGSRACGLRFRVDIRKAYDTLSNAKNSALKVVLKTR